MDGTDVYRALVRLYPRSFREPYGEDLCQAHDDLRRDKGPARAWARTALDLTVTVPRYRMESLMSERHSTTAITVLIVLLALGGATSVLLGLPSFPAGFVLLAVAVVVGVTQRSHLARSLRAQSLDRRSRHLRTAGVMFALCLGSIVTYAWDLSDDRIGTASLLLHSLIGTSLMIGSVVFALIGLLSPRRGPDAVPAAPAT